NVIAYLTKAREHDFYDNNWKFFRVLIDLGLITCGAAPDAKKRNDYLDELEPFHLGQGWYRDGPVKRIDHYTPFALHFYGLIYAELAGDAPRAALYRDRARDFAPDIRHWFADDGAALPFGRSLTYRFACGGFWGALAFAGVEALPWGEIKGYYMRHLRWWADKPIADRDGVLSVGYGYPNLMMSESYNSAGSPYWAMKAFLPLALPADHPFWQAEELPAPMFDAPHPLPSPGMVAMHQPGNTTILCVGQEHAKMRGAAEKYSKFVYSTRYGFSIEADDRNFNSAAFDGTLGLSDDGVHLRMRETSIEAMIAGDALYTRWRPYSDVEVETWLVPAGLWHLRYHLIKTQRPLFANEGGFAVAKADFGADQHQVTSQSAHVRTPTDISVIFDTFGNRTARVHSPTANTNLIHAKTLVPQLQIKLQPGETLLSCAVLAMRRTGSADGIPPLSAVPDLADVRARFDSNASAVLVNVLNETQKAEGPKVSLAGQISKFGTFFKSKR
ncbi:MAG: DUF2264 domain-containing protein, partial [Deltaproteobacteria bacterium]